MTPSATDAKDEKQDVEPAELPDKIKPENYPEAGFRDVSDEAEKAPEGDTEAQAVVSAEMSHRATAQANGGGPWPPELIAEKFIGAGQPAVALQPEYTSHEEESSSSGGKSAAKKK